MTHSLQNKVCVVTGGTQGIGWAPVPALAVQGAVVYAYRRRHRPPQVANTVVKAIAKKQAVLTLPRYLGPLSLVYQIAPGFSRWLANQGWGEYPDYGQKK
jgi:NAD(P)-dependent dehydrogenase (short-subunit alcohol dehydrogenase family)